MDLRSISLPSNGGAGPWGKPELFWIGLGAVPARSKKSRHKIRQEPAAVRDFSALCVRFGSSATESVDATPRWMSALPRKRTSDLGV